MQTLPPQMEVLHFLSSVEVSVHQMTQQCFLLTNLCHILHLHVGSPSMLATNKLRLQYLGSVKKQESQVFGPTICFVPQQQTGFTMLEWKSNK